jgi:hypothetical protein
MATNQEPSTFDIGEDEQEDFDPSKAEPGDRKELSPARKAAIEKMQAGKRAALERKKKEQANGGRNKGEQRVHPTSGHGAVHDENLDAAGTEGYESEFENEVTEWVRPSEMDSPPPRPGFVQRWIRIRLGTVRDTARLRKAMREGWRAVKASAMAGMDHSLPIIQHDQLGDGDYIGAEDLILMEMPESVNRQRETFYKRRQARQTGAIERQVKGVHREDHLGFGPVNQRNISKVRRGPGVARAVEPAGDEVF